MTTPNNQIRPIPDDWQYGPYSWTLQEKQRIQNEGLTVAPRRSPGEPMGALGRGWRSLMGSTGAGKSFSEDYGRNPTFTESIVGRPTGLRRDDPPSGTSRVDPASTRRGQRADAARYQGIADRFGAPKDAGGPDWASIIAAMEGQRPGGGGVSVNRGLFNLSETGEEQRMLEREMADIEARRAAGETAVRAGFGNVQAANAAAAEKARGMAASAGEAAAATWSDAAQQARSIAAQQARESGGFEGRAGIDVSSDAGAADFIGFMESQAPAERALAERRQEILGSDLDWMAGMAGSQAEAYAGDLQRQSGIMSFERAREHNLRVQDRISQERMMLAQMEQQAQAANAGQAPRNVAQEMLSLLPSVLAAGPGGPALLSQAVGVPYEVAEAFINSYNTGLGGQALQADLTQRMGG